MKTISISLMVVLLSGGPGVVTGEPRGVRNEKDLICTPEGSPPFPAVVYNHGYVVDRRGLVGATAKGYDLKGMCREYAKAGFLAIMPIRRSGERNLLGHLAEVEAAIETTKQRADVDSSKVAVAGFSRGGLLTFLAAAKGVEASAFVIIAPAPGKGLFKQHIQDVVSIDAPVLVLVEQDDDRIIHKVVDNLERALKESEKTYEILRYNRGGGHKLFYRVNYYWSDVVNFLSRSFFAADKAGR